MTFCSQVLYTEPLSVWHSTTSPNPNPGFQVISPPFLGWLFSTLNYVSKTSQKPSVLLAPLTLAQGGGGWWQTPLRYPQPQPLSSHGSASSRWESLRGMGSHGWGAYVAELGGGRKGAESHFPGAALSSTGATSHV